MICTSHHTSIWRTHQEKQNGRTCGSMREIKAAYRVLMWKPEVQKQLGKHSRKWKENIKRSI